MTTQSNPNVQTFITLGAAARAVIAQARTITALTDAMLSRPARQPNHRDFADIRLPDGWVFAGGRLGEPTIEWPDLAVQLVVGASSRADRLTLHARFQLFDVLDGEFKRIASTEHWHEMLAALAKVRSDINAETAGAAAASA